MSRKTEIGEKGGRPRGRTALERFVWYAERIDRFRRIADDPDPRRNWRWTPYQALMAFAVEHRRWFGTWGVNALKRDEGIMKHVLAVLRAEGHEPAAVEDAVRIYFDRERTDPWHMHRGFDMVGFKAALSGILPLLNGKRRPEKSGSHAEERVRERLQARLCRFRFKCFDYEVSCAGYGEIELDEGGRRKCDRYAPMNETGRK